MFFNIVFLIVIFLIMPDLAQKLKIVIIKLEERSDIAREQLENKCMKMNLTKITILFQV